MAETLVVYWRHPDQNQVSWRIKGGLQTLSGEGTLSEIAEKARGRRTLVILPASEVLITQVRIPTRNRQRLVQAIPFTLETELTQDIEQLHFAVGQTDADNMTPVIVTARQSLDNWLSQLDSAGIEPLAIYIDLLCLPFKGNHWSLYLDNLNLLVRTGHSAGFTVDRPNCEEMLHVALQQAGDQSPECLDIYRPEKAAPLFPMDNLPATAELREFPLESSTQLTGLLADNLNEKQQINLLQGDYQRVDKMRLQWARWLPAAILAGVALLLNLTLNVSDYYNYRQQSADLDERIQQVFHQAFPDIKRVVDPKIQMEQQLKAIRGGQASGGARFANLFIPTASVIQESPNTRLESISFRDGQLDLQLTIKELQALENLKRTIEQNALTVEIRTANAAGDQVTSHLRISGEGK